MTKTLLISGSSRKGNTDFILSKICDKINSDKELIILRNKKIKHCIGCLSCHNKSECVINDDMTEIRNKMLDSDIIIIGTPNYFGNISGLLKDFVDRMHPFYKFELLKGKKLVLIMIGGGSIESSEKYLDYTMHGFIKYLKLNLVESFCFQALNSKDLEKDSEIISKIDKISQKINSIE